MTEQFGTAPDTDLNSIAETAFSESLPDITDLADEPSSGAWANGWYRAQVVEGYATRKGTTFETGSVTSKDGNSQNLRICFVVTNPKGETRNIQTSLNYRVTDFTPERIEAVKEARAEFKGSNGAWGPKGSTVADLQRSSLAVAKLGQFFKAVGTTPKRREDGVLISTPFVGASVDVKLVTTDKGFNDINEFAKSGERVGKAKAK